jgi:DNA-binding MarR family transcriptional regulator
MNIGIIDLIFQLKGACSSREEFISKKLKLSPAEFRGILVLTPGSSEACNIISRRMGLSKSRCSRVIDKMINDGYIKAAEGKDDKRIMKVSLTAKGIRTQSKIHKMLKDCESSILKKLSRAELELLEDSLLKISDVLVLD